jgi:hypothetical protein
MTTLFDVVTVTCFIGLVIAFFRFTDRDTRTLVHFVVGAIVFAVANQLGNGGRPAFGVGLLLAGICYIVLVLRK